MTPSLSCAHCLTTLPKYDYYRHLTLHHGLTQQEAIDTILDFDEKE